MQVNVKIAIEQNPNLKRYLKENSYWYHYLNRDPSYLEMMDKAPNIKIYKNNKTSVIIMLEVLMIFC